MPRSVPQATEEHLGSPEKKKAYNEALFSEVAPRYDLVTRALSLGRDQAWKRCLVRAVADGRPSMCVDLACGTGDITRLVGAQFPGSRVLGLDLTAAMLDLAREVPGPARIEYWQADMCETGLPSGTVDLVTGGYALRNAPRLEDALAEIHRILAPHGVAAFLDFSKPSSVTAQRIELFLLRTWGGFWGWALHRNPAVYRYIAASLERYPDRPALAALVFRRGFELIHRRIFFGGIMELMVLRKAG
jgi:demethylmenaquinone methyltransferase/2-methoxy-6-polyprenyl-1,4-benzoquinol methylase